MSISGISVGVGGIVGGGVRGGARHSASVSTGTDDGTLRELSPEEEEQVKKLRERDAEVRRHEQAHLAAAGQYAKGAPDFDYQVGPDGKKYAVGGEVKIDTSPIPNDPERTIEKARTIKKAALAPAKPSAKDRQVAAEAEKMEAKARKELREQEEEERVEGKGAEGTLSDEGRGKVRDGIEETQRRRGEGGETFKTYSNTGQVHSFVKEGSFNLIF
ncbi:MAG: hypothetical protein D6679_02865 [Candidatus Hydrogenedentota bacterium]|nr:MAG: hypothetical protein D6679_02865 [Candidatus Hydrogenedentota bacterium]